MYYDHDSDLPESVKNNLPRRAQRIYRRAFNDAWARGSDLEATGRGSEREERAHAAAWTAVRGEYKRRNGRWVRLCANSGEFPQMRRAVHPAE